MHPAFQRLCRRLQDGITSGEDYCEVYDLFLEVNADVRGAFPSYHFKMALDHTVEAGFIERRHVQKWPVGASSGTGIGLKKLYGCNSASEGLLQTMLNELLHRLRRQGLATFRDFQGTVGASLCWEKRRLPSSHQEENRYLQTTSQCQREIDELVEAGRGDLVDNLVCKTL